MKQLLPTFFEYIGKDELAKSPPVEKIADALLEALLDSEQIDSILPANDFQPEAIYEALEPNYDRRLGFSAHKYKDIERLIEEGWHHLVVQGFVAPHVRGNTFFVTRLGAGRVEKRRF